jgi:hypothetical protein
LEFTPQREPVRHANDGVMKVGALQEAVFQYSIPKLAISGKISVPSLIKKGIASVLFIYFNFLPLIQESRKNIFVKLLK